MINDPMVMTAPILTESAHSFKLLGVTGVVSILIVVVAFVLLFRWISKD